MMDFLAGIPGWGWFLLFLAALLFVYGLFNRRWRKEELEEQKRLEQAQKPQDAAAPNTKTRAASLRAPDRGLDSPVEPDKKV